MPYERMNMWHVVKTVVEPVCRKDGAPLALVYNNWRALNVKHFITHCWAEPFCEFMKSLRQVYKTSYEKPALFICAFALYQGTPEDIGAQLAGKVSDAPFVKALRASQRFVVVRNSVEDLYTRAWCLVEFLYAKKFGHYKERISITGPCFKGKEETSCLDVKASMPDDRVRIMAFLADFTVAEIDRQIIEFRRFDAHMDG